MDTGAVTGNNKTLLRYQAFLDRVSFSKLFGGVFVSLFGDKFRF